MGFTTEEAGQMGIPLYNDGVTDETVDSFIAGMFPGADPKPIREVYDMKYFAGEPTFHPVVSLRLGLVSAERGGPGDKLGSTLFPISFTFSQLTRNNHFLCRRA